MDDQNSTVADALADAAKPTDGSVVEDAEYVTAPDGSTGASDEAAVSEPTETVNEDTAADTMLQTDVLIKRYLRQIKELNAKIKEKNSMYKDSFSNDAEYHEVEEQIKGVQKKLKAAKERVTNLQTSRQAQQEIKELKEDMKSAKEILSSYLQKYVNETGLTTIEDEDGEVLKIVASYNLQKEKTDK